MTTIDLELERVRRAFDSPESYPGEALEGVIEGLQSDVHRADPRTVAGRAALWELCQRIMLRIEQRDG